MLVKIVKQGNWFVATSEDMPELIVCNESYEVALSEIPKRIEMLYRDSKLKDARVELVAATIEFKVTEI